MRDWVLVEPRRELQSDVFGVGLVEFEQLLPAVRLCELVAQEIKEHAEVVLLWGVLEEWRELVEVLQEGLQDLPLDAQVRGNDRKEKGLGACSVLKYSDEREQAGHLGLLAEGETGEAGIVVLVRG
jgi:hypothetical protein